MTMIYCMYTYICVTSGKESVGGASPSTPLLRPSQLAEGNEEGNAGAGANRENRARTAEGGEGRNGRILSHDEEEAGTLATEDDVEEEEESRGDEERESKDTDDESISGSRSTAPEVLVVDMGDIGRGNEHGEGISSSSSSASQQQSVVAVIR